MQKATGKDEIHWLGQALAVPKDPGVTLKAVMHTSRRHSSRRPVAREPGQLSSVPELRQQCVHGSSDPWSTHPHFYTVCTRLWAVLVPRWPVDSVLACRWHTLCLWEIDYVSLWACISHWCQVPVTFPTESCPPWAARCLLPSLSSHTCPGGSCPQFIYCVSAVPQASPQGPQVFHRPPLPANACRSQNLSPDANDSILCCDFRWPWTELHTPWIRAPSCDLLMELTDLNPESSEGEGKGQEEREIQCLVVLEPGCSRPLPTPASAPCGGVSPVSPWEAWGPDKGRELVLVGHQHCQWQSAVWTLVAWTHSWVPLGRSWEPRYPWASLFPKIRAHQGGGVGCGQTSWRTSKARSVSLEQVPRNRRCREEFWAGNGPVTSRPLCTHGQGLSRWRVGKKWKARRPGPEQCPQPHSGRGKTSFPKYGLSSTTIISFSYMEIQY